MSPRWTNHIPAWGPWSQYSCRLVTVGWILARTPSIGSAGVTAFSVACNVIVSCGGYAFVCVVHVHDVSLSRLDLRVTGHGAASILRVTPGCGRWDRRWPRGPRGDTRFRQPASTAGNGGFSGGRMVSKSVS